MSSHPTVAVAIPAYNEADGIASFIDDLDAVLETVSSHHTFVVVDDRSTDDTIAVLESRRGHLRGDLAIEPSEMNRGHGPTVVAAYRICLDLDPDIVVQVDGDGQFEAEDLALLFREFEAGAEVATGNRVTRADPWFRAVVTTGLRFLMRLGFGVHRHDTNCPFRLYRAAVLAQLLPALPSQPLVPHVELTVLETRAGVITSEVDVRHRPRRGATATGSMWRGRGAFSVPVRLGRFCGRALVELARFRRGL